MKHKLCSLTISLLNAEIYLEGIKKNLIGFMSPFGYGSTKKMFLNFFVFHKKYF